ncbi:MAG: hypothetical protein R6W68_02270 [Ignavibacteriaceae bacterium]
MKKLSFFSNVTASLSLISGSVWVGSYLVKIFITYQLFTPEDLALKTIFMGDNLNNMLSLLLPVFIIPFVTFNAVIIFMILFLLSSRISLKQNGWLFISVMIVFITMPFEIYLMTTDYKIITLLMQESVNAENVLILIRERITSLSSFPVIEILGYIGISFLIIFRPLTLKNKIT